ncbi:hypothetical protein GJ744_000087 [Endocarpon pusillum]|uniref:non-specific serine/threonine protein kinase n=1 Tax=Endocarpon pusillum TaxID=364733 RepID=A0A8H7E9L5_9EURO|nr:hypothetical protein GJ744_000087 [Endocarpon pusillum]
MAAMEKMNIATGPIGLPDLPGDVFTLIIEHLEAWDVVRCQMVSSAWSQAFSAPELLRIIMKKYPHAQEAPQLLSRNKLAASDEESDLLWRTTFNQIACRYFHLTHGRTRTIEKHKTAVPELSLPHLFPVSCWDYHESQPGRRLHHLNALEHRGRQEMAPGEQTYLFRHAFWSYEDGLLVFIPAKPFAFDYHPAVMPARSPPAAVAIMMLDLKSQYGVEIPFDMKDRVVRNIRLKDHALIIEWAEKEYYHALNDSENVHRHFVTCYDIRPQLSFTSDTACRWNIAFRSEWKLHFLGLPLNAQDRFYSTHTKDHYAVYLWQPNRSIYTGDEEQPIECLIVWDIAQPRQYMPSLDPGRKDQPDDVCNGPHIVCRFDYRLLQHYGIRQQSSPSLMKFSLNSEQQTITVYENVRISGQGYFDPAERLWCARTTTILFRGEGPHLQREWEINLPPYRGNCSMDTSAVLEPEPWFLGIMDVVDEKAYVRFSLAESAFTSKDVQNSAFLRIQALGIMATLDEATTKQIAHAVAMASTSSAYAVYFNEGPGYLFVANLGKGRSGKAMLVRSCTSPHTLYVRKRVLTGGRWNDVTGYHDELFYYPLSRYVPELIDWTNYGRTSYSMTTQFCNGGSLHDLLFHTLVRDSTPIAEIFIWKMFTQLLEVLEGLHLERLTTHLDLVPQNVFLHWPDKDQAEQAKREHHLPDFYLGDFGAAEKANDTFIQQDLRLLHSLLIAVCLGSSRGPYGLTGYGDRIPRQYSTELRRCMSLLPEPYSFLGEDRKFLGSTPPTNAVRASVMPIARKKMAELEGKQQQPDYRFTKPSMKTKVKVAKRKSEFAGLGIDWPFLYARVDEKTLDVIEVENAPKFSFPEHAGNGYVRR